MIFACSSGAAKRYIEDVARAIAMPPGMHLQFRYAAKYISPELRNTLERDPYALNGREVVLAYLDQSEARRKQHAAPKVVPCRAATIVSAEFIGTSYIFVYRLAGFAFPVTLKEAGSRDAAETVYQDYQESLHQLDCDLPLSWRRHGDRYRADGHWVCDVADAQLEVRSAPEDAGTWTMWESLVIELLTKSTDFADHGIGALFHIFYIGPESRHSPNAQMASPSQVCQFKHGQCELAVRGEHRIKLYVYAKDEEVENTAWIRFATLN